MTFMAAEDSGFFHSGEAGLGAAQGEVEGPNRPQRAPGAEHLVGAEDHSGAARVNYEAGCWGDAGERRERLHLLSVGEIVCKELADASFVIRNQLFHRDDVMAVGVPHEALYAVPGPEDHGG